MGCMDGMWGWDAGLGCGMGCWMGCRAGMRDGMLDGMQHRDVGWDVGWDAARGCRIGCRVGCSPWRSRGQAQQVPAHTDQPSLGIALPWNQGTKGLGARLGQIPRRAPSGGDTRVPLQATQNSAREPANRGAGPDKARNFH